MKKDIKIFVIGDFHGILPNKLINIAKKKDIDIVVSTGDFCGNKQYVKLFFKYIYGTDNDLADFIGKRKMHELETKTVDSGIKILKQLNSLNKKIVVVTGNWDRTGRKEIGYLNFADKYTKRFNKEIKKFKNIKIVDFDNYNFNGYTFVGYPRSTYPGIITKLRLKRLKHLKGNIKSYIKQIIKDNKEFYNKIKRKFRKDTILISHNSPYQTKLDKIKKGPMKGKHSGSYLTRKIIMNLKPILAVTGHIHEGRGICKIGKTLVINSGAANEGKSAIISVERGKVKNIKLLR